ncbi:MAG: hypothetical protein MUF00_09715 [Gemmatimonadaceae bacterium]|jgi:hypothetical protein|nr:hypothetical protein [Gemmatimonadaceae bacterium]
MTTLSRSTRRWRVLLVTAVASAAVVTGWAEWPSPPTSAVVTAARDAVSSPPGARIIVHAGRSDFAWRIARAIADGLAQGGVSSRIATTRDTAAVPQHADRAIVLVAPTYWWAPAWTVARVAASLSLARDVLVLPVVTASGQGDRSLAVLRSRAVRSGGTVLDGLALYRWRPNSEAAAAGADNVLEGERVARDAGRQLAARVAQGPR